MSRLIYNAFFAMAALAAIVPDGKQGISDGEQGAFKLDFIIEKNSQGAKDSSFGMSKRADLAELGMINDKNTYFATLEVGSNRDKVQVQVDTGSSDLFVIGKDAVCNNNATDQTCKSYGKFDPSTSTSFSRNLSAPIFNTTFGGGDYARGFWGQDTIGLGSVDLQNMSLAVANDVTTGYGILGVGLTTQEGTFANDNSSHYSYDNFPILFKKQGHIKKIAYSLYMNETHGTVLFGGVDSAKYSGQLQTVPLINFDVQGRNLDTPGGLFIVSNSLTLKSASQNITISDTALPVLLDSGSTECALPKPFMDTLAASLNAKMDKSTGYYMVDCKYKNSDAFLDFEFSGIHIKMPFSTLVQKENNKCHIIAMDQPAPLKNVPDFLLLGDFFLQHAFVVYDIESSELSLAQASGSHEENIEVIEGSVPSAVRASNYSSTAYAKAVETTHAGTRLKIPDTHKSEGSRTNRLVSSLAIGAFALGLILVF